MDAMHDINAEQAVIATLACSPKYVVTTGLQAKDFGDPAMGCIYWAVQGLVKDGIENIDTTNITSALKTDPKIYSVVDRYGGADYIDKILDETRGSARRTVDEYKMLVKQVITAAYRRGVQKALDALASEVRDVNVDISTLSRDVSTRIDEVSQRFLVGDEISTIGERADDLLNEIISRYRDDGVIGLPSAFPLLEAVGQVSYEPTELYVLKARMKKGKSLWMMTEALHKSKSGVPTLYIDTEMSDKAFFTRILSCLSHVDARRIKSGQYGEDERKRIIAAVETIKALPLVHIYMPIIDKDKIYYTCKILKTRGSLGFVVMDYIKSNTSSSSEQYNELGDMTDFLKNVVAGTLEVPVLTGVQLNRQDQVADSDKIERYASVSMLWREKKPAEIEADGREGGSYCLHVDLNRNGSSMGDGERINFVLDGSKSLIYEAPKQPSGDTDSVESAPDERVQEPVKEAKPKAVPADPGKPMTRRQRREAGVA